MNPRTIAHKIIQEIEKGEIPWERPWVGHDEHIGYPVNILTHKKYVGVNFILLQIAAKKHKFVGKYWGTLSDFNVFNAKFKNRPSDIDPEDWSTEAIPERLYNIDQVESIRGISIKPKMRVDYSKAEGLHCVGAKIRFGSSNKAFYYYPPYDYIVMPEKCLFERPSNYYNTLAHELMHWAEPRLNFDDRHDLSELRAEIGTAMLMEELQVPHQLGVLNESWIKMIRDDMFSIFRIASEASEAVNYIYDQKRTIG